MNSRTSLLHFPFILPALCLSAIICCGCKNAEDLATTPQPQPPQPTGPYLHKIYSASSTDGLNWSFDNRLLLDHASVPAAIVTPEGKIRIYYVDASQTPENTNCAESSDGGMNFTVLGCTIANRANDKALDPSIVLLPDGRYRLYYYASKQDPNTQDRHSIYSAISTDGIHFTQEQEVFSREGLVDPDVFAVGSEWLMYVFSLKEGATIIARSRDGLNFAYVGPLSLQDWGTTAQGKNPADLLGDMNAYRAVLEKIGGDSLMLTMGGAGESDPDQSKDWHEAFIYRTGGGRQVQEAFSSPSILTYGPYRVCQINYFFIDTQIAVNTLKARYNSTAMKDVVGVVTHTFNFAADSNYVIDWMQFVQSTQRKTVRQIMRDRKCNPTVTAVEEFKSIPLEFHLEQNYPNPFSNVANLNSATSISYSIPPPHPATSLVQLQIFDLLGREVKTLVRDFQTPGHYTVWWDGRDNNGQKTGAGIYIYTLRLGQQEQRKRLIKL